MPTRWIRFYENGDDYVDNLDGLSWLDAPVPRRWHWCSMQSRGQFNGHFVRRCACGAIASGYTGPWLGRNTRTRQRRRSASPAETGARQ